MAYQQLVNPFDVYYTGVNVHNFRLYVRPEDRKVLYLPWDWDSVFLRLPGESIFGTGNFAKLIGNQNNRRTYLNHMFDIVNTTFNTNYMAPWATHYGTIAGQDVSDIISHIFFRARTVLSQLPTNTTFAITNHSGENFETSNSTVTIAGTASIQVKTIEAQDEHGQMIPFKLDNGVHYQIAIEMKGKLSASNYELVRCTVIFDLAYDNIENKFRSRILEIDKHTSGKEIIMEGRHK
jgi:hypothetical protein